MTRGQKAAQTRAFNKTQKDKIAQIQAQVRNIVATGKCPNCNRKLVRNLSLRGWWQCSQYGSEQFRIEPSEKACSWQGFTE